MSEVSWVLQSTCPTAGLCVPGNMGTPDVCLLVSMSVIGSWVLIALMGDGKGVVESVAV